LAGFKSRFARRHGKPACLSRLKSGVIPIIQLGSISILSLPRRTSTG
jgi:hypothetical protein